MRTTIASALVLALAACGGDGAELSLTEPGQIEACGAVTTEVNLVGVWLVDQWGCIGRASPNGALDCDPEALDWSNDAEITISRVDADTFTIAIDGSTMTAEVNTPADAGGEMPDGDYVGVNLCANGSMYVGVSSSANDIFGAYATRR